MRKFASLIIETLVKVKTSSFSILSMCMRFYYKEIKTWIKNAFAECSSPKDLVGHSCPMFVMQNKLVLLNIQDRMANYVTL